MLHRLGCRGRLTPFLNRANIRRRDFAMPSAATIRLQIESALAHRVPSALTPAPRLIRPVAATGVRAVDRMLEGGIPVGAVTEISGMECSGRSTLAFSFLAQRTREGKVCAWVDVSNAF